MPGAANSPVVAFGGSYGGKYLHLSITTTGYQKGRLSLK